MAYSSLGTQWPATDGGNPVLTSPVLANIAMKHKVEVTDVVLSWVIQEGAVAIPRASRDDHLEANIRLMSQTCDAQRRTCSSIVGAFLDSVDMASIRSLHNTRQR